MFSIDDDKFDDNINKKNEIVSNLWIEKYKPKSSKGDQLIGNIDGIAIMKTWLNSFEKYKKTYKIQIGRA